MILCVRAGIPVYLDDLPQGVDAAGPPPTGRPIAIPLFLPGMGVAQNTGLTDPPEEGVTNGPRQIGWSTGGVPLYEVPTDGRVRYGVGPDGQVIYGLPGDRDRWLSMNPQVRPDQAFTPVELPTVGQGVAIPEEEWFRLQAENERIEREQRERAGQPLQAEATGAVLRPLTPLERLQQALRDIRGRASGAAPSPVIYGPGGGGLAVTPGGTPVYAAPPGVDARRVVGEVAPYLDDIRARLRFQELQTRATSEHRTLAATDEFRRTMRDRLATIDATTRATYGKVSQGGGLGPRRY